MLGFIVLGFLAYRGSGPRGLNGHGGLDRGLCVGLEGFGLGGESGSEGGGSPPSLLSLGAL